jgi:hypothetical protein
LDPDIKAMIWPWFSPYHHYGMSYFEKDLSSTDVIYKIYGNIYTMWYTNGPRPALHAENPDIDMEDYHGWQGRYGTC